MPEQLTVSAFNRMVDHAKRLAETPDQRGERIKRELAAIPCDTGHEPLLHLTEQGYCICPSCYARISARTGEVRRCGEPLYEWDEPDPLPTGEGWRRMVAAHEADCAERLKATIL